MLAQVARYPAITALEIGTGGWPGSSHIEMDKLLASQSAAVEYRSRLADSGLSISALSCHGNPIHPNAELAKRDDLTFRRTVQLAERLHVSVVVTFSGCPGGAPDDTTPNWITAAWPPEFRASLDWQWEQRLVPYWQASARLAADAGVKIALEAHPGFCVYNTDTMLRLRTAVGPTLGINLDPSHLWWQGMDIPSAIAALKGCIHHFHAKDVAINPAGKARDGVLDARNYTEIDQRAWTFRSVGWGHSELEWKAIISALRLAGYDSVISIEHEDAMMSIDEGLSSAVDFLSRIVLREPPAEAWWV
jgi:sugar phosphate isomerase/epimerase